MSKVVPKWATTDGQYFDSNEEAQAHQEAVEIGEILHKCVYAAGAVIPLDAAIQVAKELLKRVMIHLPPACVSG